MISPICQSIKQPCQGLHHGVFSQKCRSMLLRGTISDELPITRSTLSQHLKLKDAGLVQGEINAPYIRYCLDREHWKEAKQLFSELLN